jgi:Flp pilus assembly protein protease CpaA
VTAASVPISLVGAIALAAAVADARTSRIPNRLILAALAVLAGSWVLVAVVDDRPMLPLLADLVSGLVLSGSPAMFVIWLVAPRVLGGGDWKLLSVLGIAVGYLAPLGATVIVMGAFVGGLVVAAVVRQRNIILGPPLALGYVAAIAAVVLAPELFDNWYR